MVDKQPEDLPVAEALRLLGGVRFGRVVFTSRAMPAVRPVRHIVTDGQIIIAAGPELVLGSQSLDGGGSGAETILAYEADQLDSSGCSGWSVVVVGRARPVTGEAEAALYRESLPARTVPDQLVAISPDVVTGFRLVSDGDPVGARRLPAPRRPAVRSGRYREAQPGRRGERGLPHRRDLAACVQGAAG